jgi:hypothetical protein
VIILQKALGRENIDELLKLSEEYGVERKLGFAIPVDMDGSPLQFDVNLVSQLSDEKATGWNNATMESMSQPWEILSLDESRAYMDETAGEKIILTLGSTSSSTRLRWM